MNKRKKYTNNLNMNHKEKSILDNAIEIFRKTTGLRVEFQGYEYGELYHPKALIRIAFEDLELNFAVAVKLRLTRTMVGLVAQELQNLDQRGLLITGYVNPPIAELLKEMDLPFIDTAGNAYINQPPMFVFIKGNKLAAEPHLEPIQRAFRPAGLQVIFALLCNPGLEAEPLRAIALVADVALGTVNRVIKELEKMGYIIDMGKRGRKLGQKENLLKRWVTAYPEQLRLKQVKGRFETTRYGWWREVDIQMFGAYWGGETAAAFMTKYIKPEVTTIYTRKPIGKLILKNRLRKDPNGNVEILNGFWKFEPPGPDKGLVHPILVYADLMATGDSRNIEVAEMIYDTEIIRFVREN
jgi:hypothetical protein